MDQARIAPYQGDEPYAFISYSHKDEDRVLPLIDMLVDRGARIWYDLGIYPGDEWPETVAAHLEDCSVFVALITENYLGSKHCRREFNFSVSVNKAPLIVLLEDVHLSSGMRMQMGSVQAIKAANLNTGKCIDAIYDSPSFAVCKSVSEHGETGAETAGSQGMEEPALNGTREPDVAADADQDDAGDDTAQPGQVTNDDSADHEGNESRDAVAENTHQGNVPDRIGARKRHWPLIAAVCALAVLAVVMGFLFLGGLGDVGEDELQGIISPDDDTTVTTFNTNLERLRGRLDVFAGKGNYKLEVNGDKAELRMSQDVLKGVETDEVFQCYLTRPVNLFLFRNDKKAKKTDRLALSRQDLESVEVVDGPIEGIDCSSAEKELSDPSSYRVIKVVLTDSFAKENKKMIGSWGDSGTIGQDMTFDRSWHESTFPAGDGKTFYLVDENQEGNFVDTVVYNYTHEPLDEGFYYTVPIDIGVSWEDAQDASKKGSLQVNHGKVGDPRAVIQLDSSTQLEKLSTGERMDMESAIKSRFDLLGKPYAYGTKMNKDGYQSLFVETGTDHLEWGLLRILGSHSGISIISGIYEGTISGVSSDVSLESDGGDFTLTIDCGEYDSSSLTLAKNLAQSDNDSVTATAAYYFADAVFTATYARDKSNKSRIVLENLCFADGEPVTTEDDWFADIVRTAMVGDELPTAAWLSFKSCQVMKGNGIDSDWEWDTRDKQLESLRETVSTLAPDAEVYESEGSVLCMQLHLNVDETLSTDGLDLVKRLYEAIDFQNLPYEQVTLYLIDEDSSVHERARVFFHQQRINSYRESYEVCAYGLFANGRIERYKDAVQKTVEADGFWKRLSSKDTPWQYDLDLS